MCSIALLTFKNKNRTPTVTIPLSVRSWLNGPGSTCCLLAEIQIDYPLVEICIKMGKHERHKKNNANTLETEATADRCDVTGYRPIV